MTDGRGDYGAPGGADPPVARRASRVAVAILVAGALLAGIFLAKPVLLTRSSESSRPAAAERPALVGVNLAGGEFTGASGTYGTGYIYPDRGTAAPFLEAGMTTIRMPLLWERVQPEPFAELDQQEMARIDTALAALGGFEQVILDVHNYASYRGARLDSVDPSGAMLADLWSQLALHYRDVPQVAFGMMNEPHDIDARVWRGIAEQTLAAIRATGARNLVLVPGTAWTGAHSWLRGGATSNAAAFEGFRDPADNFVFDMHQYLDANSSGSHPGCSNENIGAGRLAAATDWLRRNHYRAFLGEFGAGRNRGCLIALDRMLDYLDRNGDVWIGWTYWAGGAWWGDYMFTVQPEGDKPRPQMTILERHVGPPRRIASGP